jgi:hypothetical protein
MTESAEFSTWAALAGAAILAGLCAIYSSSLWALIPAALAGAYLGFKGERIGRGYLAEYLARRGSRQEPLRLRRIAAPLRPPLDGSGRAVYRLKQNHFHQPFGRIS